MASVDGSYDCTVKTPVGEQNMVMTIKSEGTTFTGTNTGAMGAMDVTGTVDGDKLTWKMQVTVPIPLMLDCTATVEGDTLTGSVGAGAFGNFPIKGTRTA